MSASSEWSAVQPSRLRRWSPVVVPLAAFGLACIDLGGASLTTDEGFTRQALDRSPDGLGSLILDQELNIGLHLVLLRGWSLLAGTGELALRVPSAACLGLAAWCLVRLGDRLHLPGALAAAMFALSGFVLQHGREARNYALGTLAAVVVMDRFLVWSREPNRRHDVQYGLAMAFAAYSHFFLGGLVIAQWLALAIHPERRRLVRRLVRPAGLAGLLCLPIAAFFVRGGSRGQLDWVPELSVRLVGSVLSHLLGHGPLVASAAILAMASVGAAGWLRAAVTRAGGPDVTWGRLAVLAWLGVPATLLTLASVAEPVLHPRFVVFSAPALALVLAGAVAQSPVRLRALAGAVLVLLLLLGAVREIRHGPREDWREAVALVTSDVRAGDHVVFSPVEGRWGFDAYLAEPEDFRAIPGAPTAPFGDLVPKPRPPERGAGQLVAELRRSPGRVWLVERVAEDEVGAAVPATAVLDHRLDGVRVRLFGGTTALP